MQVRLAAAGALVAAAMVAACGESDAPTGPTNAAVPSAPRVSSVAVTSSTMNFVARGQTQQLAAQATLSNGFVENRSTSAAWASDNTGVATVSSGGLMTVGDEGQATISATLDGQRGTLQVRVQYAFRTPDPAAGPAAAEARRGSLHRAALQRAARSGGQVLPAGVRRYRDVGIHGLRRRSPSSEGHPLGIQLTSRRRRRRRSRRSGLPLGPGPDEGSRDTYALDIMVGHCGPNPSRPGSTSAISARSGCRADGSSRQRLKAQGSGLRAQAKSSSKRSKVLPEP